MNVNGVGHGAAAAHARAVRRQESAPAPEITTEVSASADDAAPSTPLVPDEAPTGEDVDAQQRDAGVGGPRGLVRRGVTDANGDGRVDGRDVAFAKHGPDHPGRGFQPEHVGGTVEVPSVPVDGEAADDALVVDGSDVVVAPVVDPVADSVVDPVADPVVDGLPEVPSEPVDPVVDGDLPDLVVGGDPETAV